MDWPKTVYQLRSTEVRFACGDMQNHLHHDSSPECVDKWIKTENGLRFRSKATEALRTCDHTLL